MEKSVSTNSYHLTLSQIASYAETIRSDMLDQFVAVRNALYRDSGTYTEPYWPADAL